MSFSVSSGQHPGCLSNKYVQYDAGWQCRGKLKLYCGEREAVSSEDTAMQFTALTRWLAGWRAGGQFQQRPPNPPDAKINTWVVIVQHRYSNASTCVCPMSDPTHSKLSSPY